MKSLEIKGWVLQFYNDLKHKNTKTKDYMKNENIKTINNLSIFSRFIVTLRNYPQIPRRGDTFQEFTTVAL